MGRCWKGAGVPFDLDPHSPVFPPIPSGPDGEMDNPTYGIGACKLEIVEPDGSRPIGGDAKVKLKVTMGTGSHLRP